MIIDYDMGNVRSVSKAFELLNAEVVISHRPTDILQASRIVLPGVGAFADGMKHLKERNLIEPLEQAVIKDQKPFLGICLGMQLLAQGSEEFGKHQGLGWIDAQVKPLKIADNDLKVPHVGWNEIKYNESCSLFNGLKTRSEFYFVHSYHMICQSPKDIVATTDYGIQITAAILQDNIFATQFHPEKSQTSGLRLLTNFVNWNGHG